jgi:predicted outer membrane repeat protein
MFSAQFSSTGITFGGSVSFLNNTAESGGGVASLRGFLNLEDDVLFRGHNASISICLNSRLCWLLPKYCVAARAGNRAQWGGAVFVLNAALNFTPPSSSAFVLNRAVYGGAMYSESSEITFAGRNSFVENSAYFGGAIQALFKTKISIKNSGYSEFQRNFCDQSGGGAILRSDSSWVNEGRAVFRGTSCCFQSPCVVFAS